MRQREHFPLLLALLPTASSPPPPHIHPLPTGSRHRQISNLFDQRPRVASNAFVAPSATVVGEVELWDKVSIWYGAVIRGDRNSVKIGNCTNVQDHAVITTVPSLDTGFPAKVDIGNMVTIGTSLFFFQVGCHLQGLVSLVPLSFPPSLIRFLTFCLQLLVL